MIDIEVDDFHVKRSCWSTLNNDIKDVAAMGTVLIGRTLKICDICLIYNSQDEEPWRLFDLKYPGDDPSYFIVNRDCSVELHRAILKIFKARYRSAIGIDEWGKIHRDYFKKYKEHLKSVRSEI